MNPTPPPFPSDSRNLVRCVRTFVGLLALRVDGGIEEEVGQDYELPGGLTLDRVVCSLMAHADDHEALAAHLHLQENDIDDDVEEIVDCIKRLLRGSPPSADGN
ncbi:MAG: hypothetical protein KDE27_06445 [Planctomycetes bacterium]|nr:hypothetical protein [Planctomycetota bacterium]